MIQLMTLSKTIWCYHQTSVSRLHHLHQQDNNKPSLTQNSVAPVSESLAKQPLSQKTIRHAVIMLWITTIFLGFVPAVYVLIKNFDPYVKHNAKQALNLFLSVCFYMLCTAGLSMAFYHYSPALSVSLLGGLYVLNMLYILLCFFGLVKGSKLQNYKIPCVLPFFKSTLPKKNQH